MNDAEFDVDTTDSVGLPGRSGTGASDGDALLLVAIGDGEGLTRLEPDGVGTFCTGCTFKEEVDPKVANRRRKSSNGAPELDA